MIVHAREQVSARRLAGALLALTILMGSLLLVAIPFGWLWLLSRIDQSYMAVYFLALGGCPLMMIGWALALLRLNRIYVRLIQADEGDARVLEVSIALAVVIATLFLAVWLLPGSPEPDTSRRRWPRKFRLDRPSPIVSTFTTISRRRSGSLRSRGASSCNPPMPTGRPPSRSRIWTRAGSRPP